MKTTLILCTVGIDDYLNVAFRATHNFESNEDLLDAIRDHIQDWYDNTPEGAAAYEFSSQDYNWGDLFQDIDSLPKSELFELEAIDHNDSVRVDHDELLMQEE